MSESKRASGRTIVSPSSKKTKCLTLTHQWLANQVTSIDQHQYRHRALEENLDHRETMIQELVVYAHEAHEDFRQAIRELFQDSLNPLDEPTDFDYPLDDYPRCWTLTTLKGYFGELFVGIIAEQFNPFGEEWEIPAFLFRLHLSAFHQLEMYRQIGEEPDEIPGRFGDDFLAFQRNETGQIIKALVCEAKCTYRHDTALIREAHIKASGKNLVPVNYSNLIGILRSYEDTDPNAREWVNALQELRHIRHDNNAIGYERYDLVSYIYGVPPRRSTTEIMPRNQPHVNYTGNRWLEAVETKLFDVEGLVEAVYQKEIILSNSCIEDWELEHYWQKVLSHISVPTSKAIAEQHCKLLTFDWSHACIGVTSLPLFQDILYNDSHIKDAFEKSGLYKSKGKGDKISIRFIIIKKN